MKKNITIFLMIAFVLTQIFIFNGITYAVTAYPFPIQFTQPDGSKITVILKGDEKVRWAETVDSYSLLFNKTGAYEYAMLDDNKNMIPSGIQARDVNQRSAYERSFLSTLDKNLHFSMSQVQVMKSIWDIQKSEVQNVFPTTGSRNLICILIGFTDLPFSKTQSDFNNLLNQLNYTTDGATGSVKDYYAECSYGQLNLNVTVAGPYTASNTMAYYGANDVNGNDANPRALAAEAVTLANPDVNYANFDNDGDGSVDGVYVIYAGYGEEAGASTNAIWAHAWNLATTLTLDGKTISKYSCSPELRSNSGTGITRIGVICHEFGHVLGAPDFYDVDYATGGSYTGTGNWDMMASGSWNNNGATPAHHNVYTKTIVYNWATPTLLTSGTAITLNDAENYSNSFYRYNTTTTNEYFLIENRQKLKFDLYIPGNGMIIYHVDGNYISTAGNSINAGSHQGMYPVCANATGNPTTTYGTINSTGCPFPGSGLKTTFSDTSTPWAKSWAGANTAKPITSITENTINKTVSFIFMGGSGCTQPTTQASNFVSSNLASTSMTIGWTRGNGNNVLVVAKAGSSVDTDAVSGTAYTANSVFGTGSQIGSGNYVVYNGSGTSLNISGLTVGVNYYFAIYEYATTSICYKFPALTGNAATVCGSITVFPYNESFSALTFPSCYTQLNTGTGITNMWTVSATNVAGGVANELKATYQNVNPATSRMILTPVNTIGKSRLDLNFKHYFDDYSTGVTYKIQTSNDLINWTDAGWTNSSGLGNVGPLAVSVPITQNLNSATTYIAFVLDGNLYNYDYWYIDDISISATQAVNATLNVSTASLSSFGNVNQNYSSSAQYFGVSGSGLTSDITINAPAGFSVSANCNSSFSSSISLSPVSGNLGYTRVWVKYNPTVLGASSGNITISATAVTTKTVAVSGTCISDAIPINYYSTATGTGALLKTQLHNIIKGHTQRTYTNLWTDFQTTDKKYNGKVWDMYSDKPCDSNYEYTYVSNQCGTYTTEGNCYNREHSLPNSWWNGTQDTMYTDLNTLVPTDGYVNNMRSNYTFGKVSSPNWTSSNGSKRGPCSYPGYTGTQSNVFEPIDEYKGDFARIYLYMATRYESRVATWPSYDANAADCFNGTSFPAFKPWQINLLMEWHNNDPVSQKEINRNNAVYSIQGNRNPFIDHPEYVAMIWQSAPLVNTMPATSVSVTSATCNGSIISSGSSNITESGIVYSLTPNPLIGNSGVTKLITSPLVSSNGNFSITVNGLSPNTVYYVRAFATNGQGTSYGNDIIFTTDVALAIISTDSVTNITYNSARINCNIISNTYSPILFNGAVYSTSPNPFSGDPGVITSSVNPPDTISNYSVNLINLMPGTVYYVKAYVINGQGVSYGSQLSFVTSSCVTQTVPYIQNFESSFPPSGWSVYNPDAGKTWQNKLTAGKTTGSDSSAYINFYSYSTKGQIDELISPTFDLTSAVSPKLIFKVAYRYYSTSSYDTLKIFYSTDCGNTYNTVPIYNKNGIELSTGGLSTTSFTPSIASDWREEVVSLGMLSGNNVKLKFQAINNYGNNLYIDDVKIDPVGQFPPTVNTLNATVLNADTIILYGRVNPNSLVTSVLFQYGNTISYGTTVNAVPANISGDTNIIVYKYITGLPLNSVYNYRVVATNSMGTTLGDNVSFNTTCTAFNLPVVENFDNAYMPNCWTTQNSSGLTDKWTISATANAGGTANELKSTYQLLNGTTRFVSPAINTVGKTSVKLSFKHFFDDYSTGANIRIQSSTDAVNWTDENFIFPSGSGNIGPVDVSLNINNNLNSSSTYLAFVISDSLGKYDYWYIDNIKIEEGLPNADFIANKIYSCLSDSIVFTNISTGSGITSYLWNFGAGAIPQTASGYGPYTVKYTTAGIKTVSLTLNGLYTTTKNNYISIQENPVGGYISGTGNICLGSSTGNLLLLNYTGNILKWQKRFNSGVWVDIINTNSTYSEIPNASGSWEYRAELSNTACVNVYSDIYAIVVYQQPISGNAIASPSSLCSGQTASISLDSYIGNIQWQQSINGIDSWFNAVGGNGVNNQVYYTPALNSTSYYRAIVSNGVCASATSNVVTINLLPSPVAGIASTLNAYVCLSNSASLSLSGFSGAIQWEQSSDSLSWSNVSGGNGSNSANYTTTALLQNTFYRAKVSVGSCYLFSNVLKINIAPLAVAGSVGVVGSPMCVGNSATLTLNGYTGNIQWIQSPTGNGSWTDVNTGNGYNTNVFTTAPLSVTTYYRAKVSSGSCPVVYSAISNVYVYPQVVGGTATANSNVCTGSSTTINLSGSSGNISWQQTSDTNGIWTDVSGGSGNTTTSYTTPNLTSNVFYRAKLSGTYCPDAYSNIISIVINTPSAGGEITSALAEICEGSSASLNLNSYNGYIQWQKSLNGIDNWVDVITGLGYNSSAFTTTALSNSVFYRAKVTNGGCISDYSAAFHILVDPMPQSGSISPLNQSICSGNFTSVSLSNYFGNIQWQQSPDGINNWNNVLSGSGINSSVYQTANLNSNVYYRAVLSNGVCQSVNSDVASVIVSPLPDGGNAVVGNNNFCSGGSSSVSLQNYNGNIQWQQSSDSLLWSDVSTGNGSTTDNYTTAALNSSQFYRAQVTLGSCVAFSNIVKVNVYPFAVGGNVVVSGSPMCSGSTAVLTLNNSVGNIQWLQSLTGTGSWSNVTTGSGFNSNVLNTSALTSKTYYRAVLSSGSCPVVYSPIANVIVYTQPYGGIATAAASEICSGLNTSISLVSQSGSILWEQSNDSLIWSAVSGGSGSSSVVYTTPVLTSGRYYRARLSNGNCPFAYSNVVKINISSPSIAGTISVTGNDSLCEGTSASFLLSNYNGNIQWQQSDNGINAWNDILSGNNFNSFDFTSEALNNSRYFRAKVANGSCQEAFTNTVFIHIDALNIAGNIVVADDSICNASPAFINIQNYQGNIQWQASSSANGLWVDLPNETNNSLNQVLNNKTFFRARVSNGVCNVLYTNIDSVFVQNENNAGEITGSKSICYGSSTDILTLQNFNGIIKKWQKKYNTGNWTDIGNISNSYSEIPDSVGTWLYRAEVENYPCPPVFAEAALIQVIEPPLSGIVSGSKTVCLNNSLDTLIAENVSLQQLKWQKRLNDGDWINIENNSDILTIIHNEAGKWEYRVFTYNGVCDTVFSAEAVIYVNPLPLINAGNDDTLCKGDAIVLNASGGLSYQWNNNVVQNLSFTPDSTKYYTVIGTDSNNCSNSDSILITVKSKILHIKVLLEGLYAGNELMLNAMNETAPQWGNQIADKINVELRNSVLPYNVISNSTQLLSTDAFSVNEISCNLNTAFYLVVKHRNHIETWSATPVSFAADTVVYDFTTSASQAYGDNQKQLAPGVFAIMVGDVNQDGVVDISDLVEMDADLTSGNLGYIVYDLNGDGVVDISDLVAIDENLTNGVVVITP